MVPYLNFVAAKAVTAADVGIALTLDDIHPALRPHCRDIVHWAIRGGRRAIFADFGLHKTSMQLELTRLVRLFEGGLQLQIAPLNVILEGTFDEDAKRIGEVLRFVRSDADIDEAIAVGFVGTFITNYESVREGKIAVSRFNAVSLDEADCLRGFGGTKTFREFMAMLAGDDRKNGVRTDGIRYRFVATATPSPNEYIELLAYAAFLGVMDVGQAKTRFFKRNSEKADQLTIHAHKEDEFWLWVNSWAAIVQKPSDLGHSDDGYNLPPLRVHWHEVASDHSKAGTEKDGQAKLLKTDAIGVVEAAREKRESIDARMAKVMELRAEDPDAHRLIWSDLEAERHAVERAIPDVVSIYGSQDTDDRARAFEGFKNGTVRELSTKPVIAGAGGNLQKHCAWEIFAGVGFKFRDFIQAIHRVYRFGQTEEVRIDIIYTEAERNVRAKIERSWRQHDEMRARMSEIIRTYGLGLEGAHDVLARSSEDGSGATCEEGHDWKVWRNDTVLQTAALPDDSVGLIVTSVPFSTQYEYTPSYNDFGHSDDNAHFFRQMDFLSPGLLRVLRPGRKLYVHVKDRTRPGGLEGVGFQTVDPFHADCIAHYRRHGFYYMGMVTVETDVVRENNQTYRLGWTEKCKDGSRMSVGMPEYVLIFRKAPTDNSNGYADDPVVHGKKEWNRSAGHAIGEEPGWSEEEEPGSAGPVTGHAGEWRNPDGYSRARWQTDAHGKWRSSGDRLPTPDEFVGLDAKGIYRKWREHSTTNIYDYEAHVAIAEALEKASSLPPGFALLPPHAWHPEVWSDVARMRTLNGEQAAKGREMHLCPLQFDIVDRIIEFDSNPGDVVYDPFGGLMTVPLRAVMKGRIGWASELNPGYFADGVRFLQAHDAERATPSLFDLLDMEKAA
jgi:DNA modification methylase